jgi:hypothetical protein
MPNGVIPSVEFNEQLKRFVRENLRRERGTQRQGRWHKKGGRADLTVVLDEGLASATNALTSPATATASVLRKNSSGNLEDTGDNITVVNRYEHIELEQYTIGMAKWIDAEWRLYSADCEALGSWP